MTANQTIDGVPRDDLELVLTFGCTTQDSSDAWDRLRALLDAPVVERREPKGAILRFREYVGKGQDGRDLWHDWTEWSTGTVEYAKSKLDQVKDLTNVQFEVEWLYAEQPTPLASTAYSPTPTSTGTSGHRLSSGKSSQMCCSASG
ncbi:hypothetical protein [Pseudomonas grimontii]|uniref:hypothetical protein n=1 Tax=Pseudomonas grimontii TaxID=129847 RepID=UPI0028E80191|nr:hypothetical protein [Pseudomonas grimontii]